VPVTRTLLLVVVAACSGRPPPPKPPPPLDAHRLAELIFSDLTELGAIAARRRGRCAELTADLEPHVARMKRRRVDVETMLRDAKQAGELKTALAAYADRSKPLTDKIAIDLADTYKGCCPATAPADAPPPGRVPCPDGDCSTRPACPAGYRLERVIADMPTY
jgi:hypothetical protein